jgi:hypothetical protein
MVTSGCVRASRKSSSLAMTLSWTPAVVVRGTRPASAGFVTQLDPGPHFRAGDVPGGGPLDASAASWKAAGAYGPAIVWMAC